MKIVHHELSSGLPSLVPVTLLPVTRIIFGQISETRNVKEKKSKGKKYETLCYLSLALFKNERSLNMDVWKF